MSDSKGFNLEMELRLRGIKSKKDIHDMLDIISYNATLACRKIFTEAYNKGYQDAKGDKYFNKGSITR